MRTAQDTSNEQIWHAYELSQDKEHDMVSELADALAKQGFNSTVPKFNLIWLLDDFSGSGNTYIRFDDKTGGYKGKIKKVYEQLHKGEGELVDKTHYEIFLLLYVATRQAIDHIEYWTERFASENGYKPLQMHVICPIERETALSEQSDASLMNMLRKEQYVDLRAADRHFLVGGTTDPRWGFGGCSLPIVLAHNTPNNSLYVLWGPENFAFPGLFPRVSRHREF